MASGASNTFAYGGDYWRAYLRNTDDVWVRHAERIGGTLSDVQVTTSADCLTPRLCQIQNRRMLLTYSRPRDMTAAEAQTVADPAYVTTANIPADFPTGINAVPAVYERYSDDEGATWSAETLLTMYGISPTPVFTPDGTLLRTFLRSQNFPYGPYGGQPSQYSPYGQIQYPSDSSPRTVFHYGPFSGGQPVFARITAPQVYGICFSMGRFWMHWPLSSTGQTGLYHSTDDGATWAQGRLPRAAMDGGNVKLGLAAGRDGTLLLWTLQDQTMSASQIVAGAIMPGQVFSDPGIGSASFGVAGANLLHDHTGSAVTPGFEQDIAFAQEWDASRRWIMATQMATDSNITEWWSADESAGNLTITAF